jgi:hypothetical protein
MLGGALSMSGLLASTYRAADDTEAPAAEVDPATRTLLMFGPTMHWHPTPEEGLYYQLGLGIVSLQASTPQQSSSTYSALGGGMQLGVGYEWLRTKHWHLGALALSQVSLTTGTDEQQDRWWHLHSTAVSLNITASYN